MKAFKVVGIIIVLLAGLILIVPLFLPMTSSVKATKSIEASPITVFRQVNKLKNWKNWSPFENDSTMVNTFEGNDRGVGAIRSWSGDKAGTGKMTIVESEPYTKITNKLEFADSKGIGSWKFDQQGDSVIVSWELTIKDLSYPFARLMGPLMKYAMDPLMNSGLSSLKEYCENQPKPADIKIIDTDMISGLAIYDSAKVAEIGNLLEKNYGSLMDYISKRKYSIAGAPIAVYHNWDPMGYTRISAFIPLEGKYSGKGSIKDFNIVAGKAVFTKHFGGYDTGDTHWAIEDYLKDFNIKTKDFIWQEYVTDPKTEPDSTKWQTNIYYPIK